MSTLSGKVGALYKEYSSNDKSKLIADFQSDETWTIQGGTQSVDTTNIRLGTQSVRLADDDDTLGFLATVQNSLSLNLAQFESGASSDTADYIFAVFFVNDATRITSVSLSFSSDATWDGDPFYGYNITSVVEGWNYVKIKKSAFFNINMSNWTSIQSIQVGWTSTAGANTNNTYVAFQSLYLLDDSKTYDFALINNTAYILEFMTLFYNWTADVQTDVEDITSFLADGVTFKEFIATLNSFTVISEKFWANDDFLSNLQSDFVLSLYVDTTNGYRYDGLAKITSDNIATDVQGVVNESISFQGDGDLKYVDVQIIDS